MVLVVDVAVVHDVLLIVDVVVVDVVVLLVCCFIVVVCVSGFCRADRMFHDS